MKKIFWMVGLMLLTGIPAAAQQDTMRMRVQGTSAAFSFKIDKAATYYVNWGDGQEQRQPYDADVEHELTHTYAAEGAYNIIFYCDKEKETAGYVEQIYNIEMVKVEGGEFMMGCESEQALSCDHSGDYEKQKVILTDYYISKYEITQAQWKAVMGTTIQQQCGEAGGYGLFGVGDNYPMYYVSWNEAKEFCDKLSEKTGKNYALPTEAQWEFAARGGVKSKGYKYSGSNTLDDVAWHDANSGDKTHEVGTKAANELGVYDMSGNVREWCADWYADSYGDYSSDVVTNPTGPSSGYRRVIRGGSWYGWGVADCCVSCRDGSYPDTRNSIGYLGFRVVCLP